jgi:hypothetical protein
MKHDPTHDPKRDQNHRGANPARLAVALVLSLLSGAVLAQQGTASATPAAQDAAETRNWIELQQRAGESPAAPRPMAGEVADQVYQRYLKSFSHPIPEQFERGKFVEGGGSQ